MTKGLQINRVLKWTSLLACLGIFGWLTIRLAGRAVLPMYDFLEYWSAGRLLNGEPPSPCLLAGKPGLSLSEGSGQSESRLR